MERKLKNILRAIMDIVVGVTISLAAVAFILFFYFSTVLPGMHMIRYTLYLLSFLAIGFGLWVIDEGESYLSKRCKRYWAKRINRRR